MPSRQQFVVFITIIQSILFLAHFALYETWTFSPQGRDLPVAFGIKVVLGILAVSFIASSLLAFRYTNAAVRAAYKASAIWLGLLSFLFLATAASWILFGVARLAGLDIDFHRIVQVLFGAAVVF